MDTQAIDEGFELPEAAEFLTMLLDLTDPPTVPGQEAMTYLDDLKLELPVEMQLRSDQTGRMQLRMSPPTQIIMTSVFPVMHKLRLRLKAHKNA